MSIRTFRRRLVHWLGRLVLGRERWLRAQMHAGWMPPYNHWRYPRSVVEAVGAATRHAHALGYPFSPWSVDEATLRRVLWLSESGEDA